MHTHLDHMLNSINRQKSYKRTAMFSSTERKSVFQFITLISLDIMSYFWFYIIVNIKRHQNGLKLPLIKIFLIIMFVRPMFKVAFEL